MIFPFSAKTVVRDPFDPAGRIDREISDRIRRLALGVHIDDDFRTVTGALIVVEGKGKYLRVLQSVSCSREMPPIAADMLCRLAESTKPSMLDLTAVQADIAITQATVIEELKRQAGKYVDRLLIVALTDSGIEFTDNEDQSCRVPICDPDLIADMTGISVIDGFRARDLMAGGSGCDLDALPAWILYGDRAPRAASRNRVLFSIGRCARAFYLPASDGLDGELPEIQTCRCPGLSLFDVLDRAFGVDPKNDLQRLNVDGAEESQIVHQLTSQALRDKVEKAEISIADCVRSLVVNITNEISEGIKNQIPKSQTTSEIIIHCEPELRGTFVNQFRRLWSSSEVIDGMVRQQNSDDLDSVLSAVLGVICVDQLPANIPWITGASAQKILGRITPGSPCNWRQLLREMADFQPPAMRLRDAV